MINNEINLQKIWNLENTILPHPTRITSILYILTSLFLKPFSSRTTTREIALWLFQWEAYRRFRHCKNYTDIRYTSVNNFYIVKINRNYVTLDNDPLWLWHMWPCVVGLIYQRIWLRIMEKKIFTQSTIVKNTSFGQLTGRVQAC
jgi:hypothetical protein